jgi:hypothetical protein
MAIGANAQVRDYRGDRIVSQQGRLPMDRLMADLDRAQANSRFDRGDRGRFARARKEIYDFQRKFAAGRYDRRELDQAIGSVQRVVDLASINRRDRAVLMEDLSRMREFRANFRGSSPHAYGYR